MLQFLLLYSFGGNVQYIYMRSKESVLGVQDAPKKKEKSAVFTWINKTVVNDH